jgi:hypothetical protein
MGPGTSKLAENPLRLAGPPTGIRTNPEAFFRIYSILKTRQMV